MPFGFGSDKGRNINPVSLSLILLLVSSLIVVGYDFLQRAYALTNDNRYGSGYSHGCSDATTSNHTYLERTGGPRMHTGIFMQGYNEGLVACSASKSAMTETFKMFVNIRLNDTGTSDTNHTQVCASVYYTKSLDSNQTQCQSLLEINPKDAIFYPWISSKVFTFYNVPVNATYQSCIIRSGDIESTPIKTCDLGEDYNYKGPTVEQTLLPFFGVDPASAIDEDGYLSCPENITEVQCYGKIVRTPDDGRDINETTEFSR
jgi:hypothetical protein